MATLEEAQKSRKGKKGWATRAKNVLVGSISNYEKDGSEGLSDVQECLKDLEKKMETLAVIQATVEDLTEEEALEAEIEKEGQFYDSLVQVKNNAMKIIKKEAQKCDVKFTNSRSENVRLPKLELPKFSGNILQYATWLQAFRASIDKNSRLQDIEKFTYLKGLLEDEAAECINGLALTSENYAAALDILDTKYGRKELHIFTHIQKLMELPMPTNQNSLVQVKDLENKILVHIRSLDSLGIEGTTYGVILTPMILMRLPQNIRLEWARNCKGFESDLNYLLKFLREEISRRERSEMFKVTPTPTNGATPPAGAQLTVMDGKKGDSLHYQPRGSGTSGYKGMFQGSTGTPGNRGTSQGQGASGAVGDKGQRTGQAACFACGQNSHGIYKCPTFLALSVGQRREKVKVLRLCYKCLMPSHKAENCTRSCFKCRGPHNVLCCLGPDNLQNGRGQGPGQGRRREPSPTGEDGPFTEAQAVSLTPGIKEMVHYTLMPTAKVNVKGCKPNSNSIECTILIDSGADRTYVTTEVVKRVDPKFVGSELISYTAFGGSKPREEKRSKFILELSRGDAKIEIEAMEIPVICAEMKRPALPRNLVDKLKKLNLANPSLDETTLRIDLLIGIDQMWRILDTQEPPRKLTEEPPIVAQNSIFGYVVSGTVENPKSVRPTFSQMICLSTESMAPKLWDLDTIGVPTENEALESNDVQEEFMSTLKFCSEDNRYVASLTWKKDHSELNTNYFIAKKHLFSLAKRMDKNHELAKTYENVFDEMETKSLISEIPPDEIETENKVHYLTHRPVIREDSTTTKVRPVFNASLKGENGICLNDCLYPGPCLIPLAIDLLLRFRRWPVAVTADISKAFHQILLAPKDRDVHRFLTMKDGVMRIMRFNRVTFGINASPFILNATIKFHLSHYDDNDFAVRELRENLFVDDFLSGSNSESEAKELIRKANEVINEAGMNLRKWSSNRPIFEDLEITEDFVLAEKDDSKILGVYWNRTDDCFHFRGLEFSLDTVLTKRMILSIIARLYDPFGFLMPVHMTLKILFQDCWVKKLEWDDILPDEMYQVAKKWIQDVAILRTLKIQRPYSHSYGNWMVEGIEVHAFADASTRGYGSCVYVVLPGKEPRESTLVLSRARVAPLEKLTLPRLELLACLLTARALDCVRKALKLENCSYYCYSDSMIAIAWIQAAAEKWNQWVSGRVKEIQKLTDSEKWIHVVTKSNVADFLTRGASASQLVDNDTWFCGPQFIRRNDSSDGHNVTNVNPPNSCELLSLAVSEEAADSVEITKPQNGYDISRYGDLTKALRMVAWARRYLHNLKAAVAKTDKNFRDLSVQELNEAQNVIIRQVQIQAFAEEISILRKCSKSSQTIPKSSKISNLSPRIDENGILRKQTRLDNSDIPSSAKSPIILPKGHLARILVRYIHNTFLHVGVDTMISLTTGSFWIIGLRSIAKNVKRSCIPCQKIDAKAFNEVAAPLPRDRITKSPPFTITGVDYAGPLYASDGKGKLYILLFTCAVTRGVHLELVDNLTTDNFLLAMRRLSARRSRPKIIYSDNARTFYGAQNVLVNHFGPFAPKWKFIAPRSPWWGGWWERLVRSVKSSLIKTLGKNKLTKVELETTLMEVESCINSRPLTFVGDTPDYKRPLTPNDFLIGQNSGFDTLEDNDETKPITTEELSEREQQRLDYLERCWQTWYTQYLRNLPTCVAKFGKKGNIEIGRLVLIHEDAPVRRQNWPLGIVIKLHYSSDGLCRAADVRTAKGLRTRDIRRLYNLELNANHPELITSGDNEYENIVIDDDENITVENGDDENANVDTSNHDSEEEIEVRPSVTITRFGRIVRPRQLLDL